MTSAVDLHRMLRVRYPSPAWAYLEEVAPFTGLGGGEFRYADAVALSLWSSRGIALHGFEIKVSRSDARKEIEDPRKAEAVGKFCDYWWLVVADAEIASGIEVPETWGVLAPRKGVLHAVKKAPKRDRKDWNAGFVASLFRRFSEQAGIPKAVHIAELAEANERVAAKAAEHVVPDLRSAEAARDRFKKELDHLKEGIDAFTAASGVDPRMRWNGEHIGRAVDIVVTGLQAAAVAKAEIDRHLQVATTVQSAGTLAITKLRAALSQISPPVTDQSADLESPLVCGNGSMCVACSIADVGVGCGKVFF